MSEDIYDITKRWADAFAAPMPDGVNGLLALASDAIVFKDPFNDVQGKPALKEILIDMAVRCHDPKFTILDIATSSTTGYIRWVFDFRTKANGPAWQFQGMSEIQIGPDGLVAAHIDHWDSASQLMAKLPLLGRLVNLVQRRLAVTPPPQS